MPRRGSPGPVGSERASERVQALMAPAPAVLAAESPRDCPVDWMVARMTWLRWIILRRWPVLEQAQSMGEGARAELARIQSRVVAARQAWDLDPAMGRGLSPSPRRNSVAAPGSERRRLQMHRAPRPRASQAPRRRAKATLVPGRNPNSIRAFRQPFRVPPRQGGPRTRCFSPVVAMGA